MSCSRLLVAVAACAVASEAFAHVMDDAYVNFRSLGCTKSEDGQFTDGDARDSLTLGLGANALGGGKRYGYPEGVLWRTERVVRPYTGVARDERVLYLAQPVNWNDAEPRTAEVWPGAVQFAGLLSNSNISSNYTIFVRVRFDKDAPYGQSTHHFLDVGYSNGNSGSMLSVVNDGSQRFISCYYGTTNSVGEAKPQSFAESSRFQPNEWLDVCLSVSGRTFNLYTCRTNSTLNVANHIMSASLSGDLKLTRYPFALLGTEDGAAVSKTTITEGVKPSQSWGRGYCAPRMSVNQLAIWGRALSEAEVREVMADGLPETFRVGAANGKTQEFSSTLETATADVTAVWTNFPAALASGKSVTFRFPTPNAATTNLAEVFRWTATADSAAGKLRIDVNGKAVETIDVVPGGTAYAFVKKGVIDRTTGNELTVTRTDGGTGVVTLDSASLGGSWQVGLEDKSSTPFCAEWLNTPSFFVTDTDWSHLRRVVSESANRTNLIFHFDIPKELLDKEYRFVHEGAFNGWYQSGDVRDHQGYRIVFNDRVLDEGNVPNNYTIVNYALPQELLRERDNVLQWVNTGTSSAQAAPYYPVDFFRVFVKPPREGLMLLLR